ncbi:uncharacterized protein LOC143767542 [Ranitomeya variabilis]|uniref:uncharacterized protein LOC143767542 n=1 Tax=Ranitomeya variabilis TaxID=490064 RepID=UPI00405635EF
MQDNARQLCYEIVPTSLTSRTLVRRSEIFLKLKQAAKEKNQHIIEKKVKEENITLKTLEKDKLDTTKKRRLTKSRRQIITEMQERWEKEARENKMVKTLEEDEKGKTTTLIIYETSV